MTDFLPEIQRRFGGSRMRRHCAVGSDIAETYAPVYDAHGAWHLEANGTTNRYLDIQSHADSCDLNVLMARYRNGETDVLSRVQGVYGDVSQVPRNYAEILNASLKARQLFDSLTPEVKEKYDNSIDKFMASFSSREGWEAIGYKFASPDEPAPNASSADGTDGGDTK